MHINIELQINQTKTTQFLPVKITLYIECLVALMQQVDSVE